MALATTEFSATARWIRVSPQKARLVLDLIKGRRVEDALNTLTFTNKRVATQVYKLVRSALDNAQYLNTEKGMDVDVDNLYVRRAIANDGPRMKRIRPAPQGRAYRYQRRMSHIEVALAEKVRPEGTVAPPRAKQSVGAKPARKSVAQPSGAKKTGAKRFGLNRPWPGGKK